jgi:hypothetical protein
MNAAIARGRLVRVTGWRANPIPERIRAEHAAPASPRRAGKSEREMAMLGLAVNPDGHEEH